MTRLTLKELLANKVRLLLTSIAIVLGVGFVSGSFVLGDTLNATFDQVFDEAFAGQDVIVRSADDVSEFQRPPISDSVLPTVEAVDGVDAAAGEVGGIGVVPVEPNGDPVETTGAPRFGFSWTEDAALNSFVIDEGRPPEGPDEVVLDKDTFDDGGFDLGERIGVITQQPLREFELVGTASFGEENNLAGAVASLFALPTAQELFDKEGELDSISIRATDDVSTEELIERLQSVLPDGIEAVSAQSVAQEQSDELQSQLSFLTIALQVFAFIAVFVAAFIIFNTFSITVAQRMRQLGLLRAVGASGAQVTRMVLGEAFVIGLLASVAGLFAGLGVAWLLQQVFTAVGFDLSTVGLQFEPRTWIVSILVGLIVTLVAATAPALRAARVPPLTALRTDSSSGSDASIGRGLLVGGTCAAIVGFALFFGASALDSLTAIFVGIGVGALLIFLGVAMLSPALMRPLARVIGAPIQRFGGVSGKLGRENAMRNPRRTATTAAALMVGLALVGVANIFSASLVASVDKLLDEQFPADFIVRNGDQFALFSPLAASAMEEAPDVTDVSQMRPGEVRVDGDTRVVAGLDPTPFSQVYDPDFKDGGWSDLMTGGVLLFDDVASDAGVDVGDTVEIDFAQTGTEGFRVDGIFREATLPGTGQDSPTVLMTLPDFERNFTPQQDVAVFANAAEGIELEEVQSQIEDSLSAFPQLSVENQQEFKDSQRDQVNQVLALVFALLALTIIIAIFGIVNTLALTIFERTREIGLLRAVGLSPRQSRLMVTWESVIVSLIGGLIGLVLGVVLGAWLVRETPDVDVVSIPWGNLVIYLVLSGVAGVLAAVLPARRASKLNVLRAISQE